MKTILLSLILNFSVMGLDISPMSGKYGYSFSENLHGVDSDDDGVRDDLQRFINAIAKENNSFKSDLRAKVKSMQSYLHEYQDSLKIKELIKKEEDIDLCLEKHYSDVNNLTNNLNRMLYASRDRLKIFLLLMDTFQNESGYTPNGSYYRCAGE